MKSMHLKRWSKFESKYLFHFEQLGPTHEAQRLDEAETEPIPAQVSNRDMSTMTQDYPNMNNQDENIDND